MGIVSVERAPGGITTSDACDADGNQLTTTDADGVVTTNSFTPADQVGSTTYSGSSAPSVAHL